jgi:hypothetical protein
MISGYFTFMGNAVDLPRDDCSFKSQRSRANDATVGFGYSGIRSDVHSTDHRFSHLGKLRLPREGANAVEEVQDKEWLLPLRQEPTGSQSLPASLAGS